MTPPARERTKHRGTNWYGASSSLVAQPMDELEIGKTKDNKPVATMRQAVFRLQIGRFIIALDKVTEQYVGIEQIDSGLKKIFGRKNAN